MALVHRNVGYTNMRSVFPLATFFAAGVMFGNIALLFIPVSFDQIVGAMTPACVAAMNAIFFSKFERGTVYVSLIPVVRKFFGVPCAASFVCLDAFQSMKSKF